MLIFTPYIIGLLLLGGILLLALAHKPLNKKAKTGLIAIGSGITLMLCIMLSGFIVTFDSLDDGLAYINGMPVLLKCEGKNSAVVIPQKSVGKATIELYGFTKHNNKWRIKTPFSSINYSQNRVTTAQYVAFFFSVEDENERYILIRWIDDSTVEGILDLSDNIGSEFFISQKNHVGIGLTYIPEMNQEYELYIDGEQVDLSSIKDDLINGADIEETITQGLIIMLVIFLTGLGVAGFIYFGIVKNIRARRKRLHK